VYYSNNTNIDFTGNQANNNWALPCFNYENNKNFVEVIQPKKEDFYIRENTYDNYQDTDFGTGI
jgi:hypothetical protein